MHLQGGRARRTISKLRNSDCRYGYDRSTDAPPLRSVQWRRGGLVTQKKKRLVQLFCSHLVGMNGMCVGARSESART